MAPYTHPEFARWADHLSHARNGYSRPIANNTTVHWDGENAISFRFHSTDVVTLRRDGSRQLRTNGWDTVTTKLRIRDYGSRYVTGKVDTCRADADQWHVRAEDDPNDPHPLSDSERWHGARARRTIPKPFHALDPGPEPQDDGDGCIADTREEWWGPSEEHIGGVWGEPQPWEFVYRRGTSHMTSTVKRWRRFAIVWGKESYRYGGLAPNERYKQCPHCKEFEQRHEAWHTYMYGPRWGRGSEHGYSQMCEWLDRFETREHWQAEYLAELRETRALNQRVREWEERNWLPFYDGITVTAQGLVPLKAKREHCKKLAAETRAQVRRERTRRQRDAIAAKLERKRCEERKVRRMIAAALAGDLVAQLQDMRTGYPIWKEQHST